MEKVEIEEMADAHWKWLNGFMETLSSCGFDEETLEYVYKTAFVHGFKHGVESRAGTFERI